MTSVILNAYLLRNIFIKNLLKLSGKAQHILTTLDRLPLSGIKQKKRSNLTQLPVKKHGRKEENIKKYARLAEKNMKHIFPKRVSSVFPNVAGVPIEKEVYNLSVSHGMYYASGVLVKNCDAIRYFAMSYMTRKIHKKRSSKPRLVYSTSRIH